MRSRELSKAAKSSSTSALPSHADFILQLHREDDTKWPQKNKDGRQELEIRLGNDHISFEVGFPGFGRLGL